ncbi:MAG: hypothetical protein JXQ79_07960 [Rhodobacteraceae bacterium]|nr:hypothetical protein [Paracoccaceae bacterium]
MIVWHVLFGMLCGALGLLVSMGMDAAFPQALAAYSFAGSIGCLASAVLGSLVSKPFVALTRPSQAD